MIDSSALDNGEAKGLLPPEEATCGALMQATVLALPIRKHAQFRDSYRNTEEVFIASLIDLPFEPYLLPISLQRSWMIYSFPINKNGRICVWSWEGGYILHFFMSREHRTHFPHINTQTSHRIYSMVWKQAIITLADSKNRKLFSRKNEVRSQFQSKQKVGGHRCRHPQSSLSPPLFQLRHNFIPAQWGSFKHPQRYSLNPSVRPLIDCPPHSAEISNGYLLAANNNSTQYCRML